jgi:hypothetical protein
MNLLKVVTFYEAKYQKQGDALSPLLFNFGLEYAINRVQGNQEGLKLNGTRHIFAYVDDINVVGET